jgi:phosphoglycolate phosphatase
MASRNLLLFDYDGVLVDSISHNLSVVRSICQKLGFSVFPDIDYCRNAECISFEVWAKNIGMSQEVMNSFVEQVHMDLSNSAHTLPIFPLIPSVLEELSEFNDLAVITGNTAAAANKFLSHHNLDKHFNYCLGAEMQEPKSKKILRLADCCSCTLESVYYIGDAGTDIIQGKIAGVKTIAVTWGFQSRNRLAKEGPDYIFDNPGDLVKLFKSL